MVCTSDDSVVGDTVAIVDTLLGAWVGIKLGTTVGVFVGALVGVLVSTVDGATVGAIDNVLVSVVGTVVGFSGLNKIMVSVVLKGPLVYLVSREERVLLKVIVIIIKSINRTAIFVV